MIGFLEKRLLFEFRDLDELEYPLSAYADRDSCTVLFICNQSDEIKAILARGRLIGANNLVEDKPYLIYGTTNYRNELPAIGSLLPRTDDRGPINWEINAASFIFSYAFRTPKPIDYII